MKTIYFLMASVLLSGCVSMFPHTESYKPGGNLEKEYMGMADYSVFPNDVRTTPEKFKDTMVAWTGVVTSLRLSEPKDRPEYSFWFITAEHHYYDWLVDFSLEPEKYFLSPKGEGKFTVIVPVKRYTSENREIEIRKINNAFLAGNIIWAYGKPDKIESGIIRLNRGYANSADSKWMTMKKLTYGRIVPNKESFQ